MNSADRLLHWLSELGVVTAPRLKNACAALAGPDERKTHIFALPQRLCRAGHAERRGGGGLLIAPSVMLRGPDGSRLLFGARDNAMLRDAKECGVVLERLSQVYEPETWRCVGADQQLATFAEYRHIVIADLDPLAVLKSFPPIRSAIVNAEEVDAPPYALEFWYWNPPARPKWKPAAECSDEGLYRSVELGRQAFFYWDGTATLRSLTISDQREAARWLSGQRRRRLQYDSKLNRLGVTYPAPLPILIERCLRCALGSEPKYEQDTGRLFTRWYSGVPRRWATEVARILECRLQE